jgi:hypothetical protein
MYSADETADELFRKLVTSEQFARASSQSVFEKTLFAEVRRAAERRDVTVEDAGTVPINGSLSINVGLRTSSNGSRNKHALWQALSLQSIDEPKRQVDVAKAHGLDIELIRRSNKYRTDSIIVSIRPPKERSSGGFEPAVDWLKFCGANEVIVPGRESVETVLDSALGFSKGKESARRQAVYAKR